MAGPGEVTIVGCFVQRDPDSGWVRTGDYKAVPSRLTAEIFIEDPNVRVDLVVVVDAAAHPRIRRLTVEPEKPSEAVTTRLMRRIPMDFLLHRVLRDATVTITNRPDLAPRAFEVPGEPATTEWASTGPRTGRGKYTPDERIGYVAQIYNEAVAAGSDSPAAAVARTLGYSRATAARDIREARSRGFIAPLAEQPTTTTPHSLRVTSS